MLKNNDMNQVSMSSIEPAAVSTTAHHDAPVSGGGLSSESKPDSKSPGAGKASAKKINETSEMEDSEVEPTSDQDHGEDRVDVNDIPEFTIGPGALAAAPGGQAKDLAHSQDNQGYSPKSEQEKSYSPGKDTQAPFKALQSAGKLPQQLQLDSNSSGKKKSGTISQRPPQVLKQNQIQLNSNRQGASGGTRKQGVQKRQLLKKNVFDSDMGLQTGRFVGVVEENSTQIQQHLSKSANQANVLKAINSSAQREQEQSPTGKIQEFDRLGGEGQYEGEPASHLENEMRETSYFKQQTDDEGVANQGSAQHQTQAPESDPKSLSELISITNQSQQLSVPLPNSSNMATSAATNSIHSKGLNIKQNNSLQPPKRKLSRQGSESAGDQRSDAGSQVSRSKIKSREGIQMFKVSSRSQLRQRAQRAGVKASEAALSSASGPAARLVPHADEEAKEPEAKQSPLSPSGARRHGIGESIGAASLPGSLGMETPSAGGLSKLARVSQREKDNTDAHGGQRLVGEDLYNADQVLRSQSYNPQGLTGGAEEDELQIDDEDDPTAARVQENLRKMDELLLDDVGPKSATHKSQQKPSRKVKVSEKDLGEIQRVTQHNEKHVTANFGALNLQKQQKSNVNRSNYSALKGGPAGTEDILDDDHGSEGKDPAAQSSAQNQMFTSMSDIGFPANIHNYNLKVNKQSQKERQANPGAPKEELITTEQIQRMMDTQNNWRVRTKTIDEMLHDVRERAESDPEYLMVNSERLLDFFLQLLTDQNFKIVLNTLNILNIVIWMPQQRERHERLMKQELSQDECWGLSNAILGRHIPLIVKKLADSKNIIRQEAIKCLFGINEIMRCGSKKDNNFIALILPYLNNSSNWHIREELLHLLIKCFLASQDQTEFDSYQILDSIVQLFNDTKEKIRNLALEAIAAFACIGERSKVSEVMFQLNVEKDICELVQSRLDYGMFPTLNQDGNVEIPYQDQFNNNYDVDSVAHSVTNQTQISSNNHQNYQGGQEYNTRRKQSVGVASQKGSAQAKMRGNSSGRKIVVATANATNQQLGVSHQDEIMQQAYIHSKRTASANNPNQLEFEQQAFMPNGSNIIPDHNPANSFSYSVGGNTGNKPNRDQRLLPQFDELSFPQDLNGSSFLPKLQKVVSYNDSQNQQYSSHNNQRERVVGSSGGPSMGYMGLAPNNLDPNLLISQAPHGSMPISGGNKRSNKYLHGTPGHPHNYQAHFSQHGTNLQSQFNRGNSGKILGNHPMNNSISNKSPSLYDQNTTLFDMSGNVGSLFGADNNLQSNWPGGSNQSGQGHVKHLSNLGAGGNQMNNPVTYMSEMGNGEHDLLSAPGSNPLYHQTPTSYNHDQILYSAGGNRGEPGDFDGVNSSFNLGPQGYNDSLPFQNQSQLARESERAASKGKIVSMGNFSNHPATANSQNVSELFAEPSPSHQSRVSHINVIDGGFSQTPIQSNKQVNSLHQSKSQNRQNGNVPHVDGVQLYPPSNQKQYNQNTFYSDRTTATGITATTGATSQNRGITQKNKIVLIKGAGPPQHNIQPQQPNEQLEGHGSSQNINNIHRGPGPVKAIRSFGGQADNDQQQAFQDPYQVPQDLMVDARKQVSHGRPLKIKTKNSDQVRDHREPHTGKIKRNDSNDLMRQSQSRESQDGNQETPSNAANRSFSYNHDSRQGNKANSVQPPEVLSAGLKRSHFGADGGKLIQEGEDPALLTQSSKIVYIATEDLEPLKKPEKDFKKSTAKNSGICSGDWFEQFEACNIIRRVCKHHQSLILQTGNQLQSLVGILIKLADSLRSAVSRIALITLNDMFQSLKRVMEPSLDPIMKILLKKGADTSHFVAQEADNCLLSLVQNCQESKVLQILLLQSSGASRSNGHRLKMCQCLQHIVKSLGNNILFFKENDKLLIQLAKYLQDASQDVRQQAKIAFVLMSQAIMGQNELERLLQRVLNEVQYKKVKEFLEKEPTHLVANQGSQIDFVITNANNQNQQMLSKKMPNKQHQQSFKTLSIKHNGLMQKNMVSDQQHQDEPLNIQAKSIINPQLAKQESSGFLTKIAQQNNPAQPRISTKQRSNFGEDGAPDQFFVDSIKDIILKTQVNEWRLRHEAAEQLFELIRANIKKFSRNLKMVELADALCKLLTDSNAKIQTSAQENFNKIFASIQPFVENHIQMFYKSIISNLGSSNVGVRKNCEQILKQINDALQDKQILLQPLANMIQYNSNARLKPALIDQLIDLLDQLQDLSPTHQKYLLPVSYKLLDDNKNEVKSRTERLLKKLYNMIGQQVLDQCPQVRLQRVCDICLKMSMSGTNSSGKHSQGAKGTTGGFGANGNQLQLNSRI